MNAELGAGDRLELNWFKSSYSGPEGGDCVEVAIAPRAVLIRDSKHAAGPRIRVSARAWSGFVSGIADPRA